MNKLDREIYCSSMKKPGSVKNSIGAAKEIIFNS